MIEDLFLKLALDLAGREVMGSSSLFEVRTLELSLKQTENALSRLGRETASGQQKAKWRDTVGKWGISGRRPPGNMLGFKSFRLP